MLLGQQADGRHIKDLIAFGDVAWHTALVLTSLAADLGTVTHRCIWLLSHIECVPKMSRLISRTLATGTTDSAWQTRQPIRRGRLTARATILGQAVFEVLDPRPRLYQLLLQR